MISSIILAMLNDLMITQISRLNIYINSPFILR